MREENRAGWVGAASQNIREGDSVRIAKDMTDPFLGSHFLRAKSPEWQPLERRDHVSLISAAQCPVGAGLVTRTL